MLQRAIAYYRVSTRRQERSGLGLEAQRTVVERFAEVEGFSLIASVTEVETARDLLQAIQSGFSGIQEMTHRIATAAEQQSQVSGDMDRNLVNIADLAKENAATADSISAASSQLGNLSGEIGSLISRFKTS